MRRALVDNSVWRHAVEADNEHVGIIEARPASRSVQTKAAAPPPSRSIESSNPAGASRYVPRAHPNAAKTSRPVRHECATS